MQENRWTAWHLYHIHFYVSRILWNVNVSWVVFPSSTYDVGILYRTWHSSLYDLPKAVTASQSIWKAILGVLPPHCNTFFVWFGPAKLQEVYKVFAGILNLDQYEGNAGALEKLEKVNWTKNMKRPRLPLPANTVSCGNARKNTQFLWSDIGTAYFPVTIFSGWLLTTQLAL